MSDLKVRYIELENFSIMSAAMGKSHIRVDFTKMKTNICLIKGPNGTGKTGILSCIHPFAFNRVDNQRDDSNLIVKDLDGKKAIGYTIDGTDVDIVINYMAKPDNKRLIKRFIQVDGTEINPNGNDKSFNDAVELYLGLTQNDLSLVRLGDNVNNLIKKSYAERKEYISTLLSEIGAYIKFFKHVNDKNKVLKNLLTGTVNKIERLHVSDEHQLLIEINELGGAKDVKSKEIELLSQRIGGLYSKMNDIMDDEQKSIYQDNLILLKDSERKLSSLNAKLENYKFDENKCDKELVKMDRQINSLNITIDSMNSMMQLMYTELNNLYEQKESKENNIKYISSQYNLDELKQSLNNLEDQKSDMEKQVTEFPYTKDELLNIIALCQEVSMEVNQITGHSTDSIRQVVNDRLHGKDTGNMVASNLNRLSEQKSKVEFRKKNLLKSSNNDTSYILMIPKECRDKECPFIDFYDDMTNIDKESEINKMNKDLRVLESKIEYYIAVEEISKKLNYINMIIKTNTHLIQKTECTSFFNLKHICSSILDHREFYSSMELTQRISEIENYDEYSILTGKIDDFKKELKFIEANSSSLHLLEEELLDIGNRLFNKENEIKAIKADIETNKSLLIELESDHSDLEYFTGLVNNKNEVSDVYKSSLYIVDSFRIKKAQFDEMSIQLGDLNRQKDILKKDVVDLERSINDRTFVLREYNKLKEDLQEIEAKYEKNEWVKKACANSRGIPVLFQKVYLEDTSGMMNRLLAGVYGDRIKILPFNIDEKEFKIPYTTRGALVSDISSASQGEAACMNIALSFALILQALKKYNILLLDELDAPLDEKSRQDFVEILEEQIKLINSKQVFIISHNNTFENYPVDIIYTGDDDINDDRVIWSAHA